MRSPRDFRRSAGSLLVLLAALGVCASPAAASGGFGSSVSGVTMSAVQLGSGPVFGSEAGSTTCKATTMTSGSLGEYATTLTLTPTFNECKAFETSATVTSTGCKFILQEPNETEADKFEGSVDLSCEAGKSIVIATSVCEFKFLGQSGLKGMTYANDREESPIVFRATFALTGLKYTVVKDGVGCPFAGTGEKSGGTFSDEVKVEAESESGQQPAAVWPPTELCSAVPAGSPLKCGGKVITTKFLTATLSNNATWFDPVGKKTITCSTSSMSFELSIHGIGSLGEGVTGWTFSSGGTGCTSDINGNPLVTFTLENFSFDGSNAIFQPAGGFQGKLIVEKGGKKVPVQVKMAIAGGATCIYEPDGQLSARWLNGTGAAASTIEFSNQPFKLISGLNCAANRTFNATYTITQSGGGNVYLAFLT
jgi:hypothetical protein